MNTSTIPVSVVNAITGEVGTIQISLKHDGEFGFTMTLSAPLGKTNAGYWANLYYYNKGIGVLEFQAADRIASDGTASFPFDHASDYAIVIDAKSHEPVELPFTDVPEDYWAYSEIAWAYQNGYMSGTSAVSFNPGGTVSRQQVWMILARMAGADPADMAAAQGLGRGKRHLRRDESRRRSDPAAAGSAPVPLRRTKRHGSGDHSGIALQLPRRGDCG